VAVWHDFAYVLVIDIESIYCDRTKQYISFDENTMSIESVETVEKQSWFSCMCFDTQLFLSINVWGSFIVEIRLSPSVAVIREWKSPRTCARDELLDDIV
jgi:hypothetical protein